MADNVTANPGSGGATFRALSDSGTIEWPVSVPAYPTNSGPAGSWTFQLVNATNGLPVAVVGTPAVSVSGTVTTSISGTPAVNLTEVGGGAIVLGQTTMAGSLPVALASNQSALPVTGTVTANQGGSWTVTANAGTGSFTVAQATAANLNATVVGSGNFTVVQATASNLNATVTGTITANQGGTWTVQPGNTQNTTPWLVGPQAVTSGGATPYHLVSAASTNATSLKASAGTLYGASGFNTNASPRYLKLYDKASAPTVGTDTPVATLMMPGNTSGSGFVSKFPVGMKFSNGIAFAITGGIADSDTTAVGLNDCVINLQYA